MVRVRTGKVRFATMPERHGICQALTGEGYGPHMRGRRWIVATAPGRLKTAIVLGDGVQECTRLTYDSSDGYWRIRSIGEPTSPHTDAR